MTCIELELASTSRPSAVTPVADVEAPVPVSADLLHSCFQVLCAIAMCEADEVVNRFTPYAARMIDLAIHASAQGAQPCHHRYR
jgi:hypothetical protein